MRAVLQRVHQARVTVNGETVGQIGPGLVVFLGVSRNDAPADVEWLAEKVPRIRCFEDDEGRMNSALLDCGAEAMVISQFTLFGNLRKGTRPSFNDAAPPAIASALYEAFAERLGQCLGKRVPTGRFGAHMEIEMTHNGPVTLIIDTKNRTF